MLSDARYRFERGVDPEFTKPGIEMATRMILDLCGDDDTQISDVIEAGSVPDWKRSYSYDPALMKNLIGVDIPSEEQITLLQDLGFSVGGAMIKSGPYTVTPPSWRGDIMGTPDLTEEIIRIVGLDSIPSRSIYAGEPVPAPAETSLISIGRKARNALAVRGMHECVTWSFLSKDAARTFGLNDDDALANVTLQNPISSEIDVMRPSILPNLIQAATKNAAQGYGDTALFEVGPVFAGTRPDEQKTVISGIRAGRNSERHWADSHAARSVDVYDAKADALAALEAAGAPAANAQISADAPSYFHPGRSGSIRLGKNVLAYFGEFHPSALATMGSKQTVVGFEIFTDAFPPSRQKGTEKPYLKLEPLQPLKRDFAFLVDQDVNADTLIKLVKSADKKLITDASVFDIYVGKGVEDGKKSVALSITIQPKEQTLGDKDLESLMQKVIDVITKKTGATLRG